MSWLRQREERRPVSLPARLRTDDGWADVTIGNVSSRGMLLLSVTPLEHRSFVEVRSQNIVVVGRIVWTNGLQCGVSTQDRVDIDNLLSPACVSRGVVAERRTVQRKSLGVPRRASASERLDSSMRFARAFDFCALAVVGAVAAAFLAGAAFSAISRPLDDASEALSVR